MQTNFSNQIPQKVQAKYSKNDNKIIEPNVCNFVKSVLEIVACTSIVALMARLDVSQFH